MRKIITIGKLDYNNSGRRNYTAAVEVRMEDGRLSITGEIRHTATGSGRCFGAGIAEWMLPYFPNNAKLRRICEVAQEWHLNDMQAGSPAQMAYLKANPIADRLNHYTAACEALAAAGLNPDPSYIHNGKPYAYGSAWLSKELPPELIAEIESW